MRARPTIISQFFLARIITMGSHIIMSISKGEDGESKSHPPISYVHPEAGHRARWVLHSGLRAWSYLLCRLVFQIYVQRSQRNKRDAHCWTCEEGHLLSEKYTQNIL